MAHMKLSSHALDTIATDLSKFTTPTIPELSFSDNKVLQNNALESLVGVFSGEKNAAIRRIMGNIVRRLFASMEAYKLGRQHALDYVAGEREHISRYYLALTQFETCTAYTWQIADYLYRLSGVKLFVPGDGSDWERIHTVYTIGSKHFIDDEMSPGSNPVPSVIWLTNDGVACAQASITYAELADTIESGVDLYEKFRSTARARIAAARQ